MGYVRDVQERSETGLDANPLIPMRELVAALRDDFDKDYEQDEQGEHEKLNHVPHGFRTNW